VRRKAEELLLESVAVMEMTAAILASKMSYRKTHSVSIRESPQASSPPHVMIARSFTTALGLI
jgi:hypothetical protein